jgi:hypothetical protein
MSDADPDKSPRETPPQGPAHDDPSRGDYLALGIGCLVTLLVFGAAIYLGIARG